MLRDKTAVDLPLLPSPGCDDLVLDAYLADRDAVTTIEGLHAFTVKWKNLWLVQYGEENQELSQQEERIVESAYDPIAVLACLATLRRKEICEHAEKEGCEGMHIMLPPVLLQCFFLAQQYTVSTDLVLVQLSVAFAPKTAERFF